MFTRVIIQCVFFIQSQILSIRNALILSCNLSDFFPYKIFDHITLLIAETSQFLKWQLSQNASLLHQITVCITLLLNCF